MVKSKQTGLLSILAHNVKSPVKYMQFVTDYTLRNWSKMNPKDLLDCATVINESARDISELLDNLIHWAELNDGKLTPVLSDFNLRNWLKEEVRIHRPILNIKKIKVEYNIEDGLIVKSDPNLLSIAIQNVLTNAFKFSKKGDVVYLKGEIIEGEFRISVQDEGIGMKEEELAY